MKEKSHEFKLFPTQAFDARRGYTRWVTAGVGVRTTKRGTLAVADLWIDRQGKLFTRFTSLGYSLHFEIKPVKPSKITPDMKDAVEKFLDKMLLTWIEDGVDDILECDEVSYEDRLNS